jgi:uncharacterized protein (TIGR00297 family)
LQIVIGGALGVLVGLAAWKVGALSSGGAAAAALVGGVVFGLGGLSWAILLLAFFVSSSALSRVFIPRKAAVEREFAKGGRRDAGQVLANGGLGALLAACNAIFPGQTWVWVAFAGAMAAVNADTWATELGVLSPTPPRLMTTGRIATAGASGAISPLGTLAGLAGAAFLAGLAAWMGTEIPLLPVFGAVTVGGLTGSLVDSLLGSTLQAIYYCPACAKETERHPLHTCGAQTTPERGWFWLNNDRVNLFCSLAGALVAVGFYKLLLH